MKHACREFFPIWKPGPHALSIQPFLSPQLDTFDDLEVQALCRATRQHRSRPRVGRARPGGKEKEKEKEKEKPALGKYTGQWGDDCCLGDPLCLESSVAQYV